MLLDLTRTPRARVVAALRSHDQRPDGCPSYAHRQSIRMALQKVGVETTARDAARVAREFLGVLQ
jgi:hypothetical protein